MIKEAFKLKTGWLFLHDNAIVQINKSLKVENIEFMDFPNLKKFEKITKNLPLEVIEIPKDLRNEIALLMVILSNKPRP